MLNIKLREQNESETQAPLELWLRKRDDGSLALEGRAPTGVEQTILVISEDGELRKDVGITLSFREFGLDLDERGALRLER